MNCFKSLIVAFIVLLSSTSLFAQKAETFDIVTYTSPNGWQKDVNETTAQFGTESNKGTCIITMYKSIPGTDNTKENFNLAWELIVKGLVTVSDNPQMRPPAIKNGWTIESGFAGYESDAREGRVMLVTISEGGKMVNVLILADSDAFQQEIDTFLGSISLPKVSGSSQTTQPAVENTIVGTWGKASGSSISYADSVSAGNAGYTKDQYVFSADGSYKFYSKIFRYSLDKLLLIRESGNYQIRGNNLSLIPQKSVIEAWSKKDNTDKWGKLVSTQNRKIEKVTYQFTKHYFSGIQQLNLVLQTANPTERDGAFSGNSTFQNAYYYAPISSNNTAIDLP